MSKDVLIKGVEEETYRHAKATAALGGLSMGEAVNEALRMWIDQKRTADLWQEYSSDLEFVRKNWRLLEPHRGRTVVISGGKLQGVFDAHEEASRFSSNRFEVALVFVVGSRPLERDIEIGPDLEV